LSHRRAAVAVALLIAATIALHHGVIAISADMHHGHAAVAEFCLGVLTAVGAAVVAVAVGMARRLRWRPAMLLGPRATAVVAPRPLARARPSPSRLSVLCVWRC
jgi:hypothetical protein